MHHQTVHQDGCPGRYPGNPGSEFGDAVNDNEGAADASAPVATESGHPRAWLGFMSHLGRAEQSPCYLRWMRTQCAAVAGDAAWIEWWSRQDLADTIEVCFFGTDHDVPRSAESRLEGRRLIVEVWDLDTLITIITQCANRESRLTDDHRDQLRGLLGLALAHAGRRVDLPAPPALPATP